MDPEVARIEHLKIIQSVVDRMGRNSFAIKAGCLTLFAALLAASLGLNQWLVSAFGVVPLIILWWLDAFFIRQERLFRCLYDSIRVGSAAEIGSSNYFSMDTTPVQSDTKRIVGTMFSRTLSGFYLVLLALLVAVSVII
jgi:hypothetical protein